MASLRKTLTGTVVSDKMSKTIVVKVSYSFSHPLYGKVARTFKKYYCHDEQDRAKEGDQVVIGLSRPVSATKRWKLLNILEK